MELHESDVSFPDLRPPPRAGQSLLRRLGGLVLAVVTLTHSAPAAVPGSKAGKSDPWPAAVAAQLNRAGTNRAELLKALQSVPAEQREGMLFLIENMPVSDLTSLRAAYLLENVALSYEAWTKSPWHDRISRDLFFNEILPYASVNESRDAWRRLLRDKCAPLITDCRTPAEAAHRLNQKLFKLVQVRYSTERHKADQGPLETMESGKATCTGLSILLVDACRSVGVPARVVATPLWINLRGNHTWIEIWDGDWHFAGAAEPDGQGLDRGWFRHDAAQARKDIPQHAIYASSFRQTGLVFPMVWASNVVDVPAINVTDRYQPPATNQTPVAGKVRLLVQVLDQLKGKRVAAQVRLLETTNPSVHFEGVSRDETADLNNYLTFEVEPGHAYEVVATAGSARVQQACQTTTNAQQIVVLALNESAASAGALFCAAPLPAAAPRLKPAQERALGAALTAFFSAPAATQASFRFDPSLDRLLAREEAEVRRIAWNSFRNAPGHDDLGKDYAAHQVHFGKYISAYTVRPVGVKPQAGWALFIAMHGGGNAPKEVNDSQWKIMQRYYRDHPEAGGYLYLALRAPNDTWNGFYDVYVYPLIAQLIRQFVVLGEVDPNKVFIMGYSHGGYGAFAIGPKMPDRFAAVHVSAAAATDGETTPKTLRNTLFSVMVGEKDTAYGRYERALKFQKEIETLRGGRQDIYPVSVRIVDGNGHGGLPDRDRIVAMYPSVREPVPRELTWLQTDKVIEDFYWLHVDKPGKQQELDATCHDNRIVVTATRLEAATLWLDSRLVDLEKPVQVEVNGAITRSLLKPSLKTLALTMERRGDPDLAFTVALDLKIPAAITVSR